jgi:hypothetical protein
MSFWVEDLPLDGCLEFESRVTRRVVLMPLRLKRTQIVCAPQLLQESAGRAPPCKDPLGVCIHLRKITEKKEEGGVFSSSPGKFGPSYAD